MIINLKTKMKALKNGNQGENEQNERFATEKHTLYMKLKALKI